jgi:hypothetical protein
MSNLGHAVTIGGGEQLRLIHGRVPGLDERRARLPGVGSLSQCARSSERQVGAGAYAGEARTKARAATTLLAPRQSLDQPVHKLFSGSRFLSGLGGVGPRFAVHAVLIRDIWGFGSRGDWSSGQEYG